MHFYFSHSYRDVAINTYFLDQLVKDEVALRADQKSTVWCVPKLERYMFETAGFISVIPRRASDQDAAGFSPYIAEELDLARRARVPRLLFVDRQVLERHVTRFPHDAVPFDAAAPEQDARLHVEAIRRFMHDAKDARQPLQGLRRSHEAALLLDDQPVLRHAAGEVEELLNRAGYSVKRIDLGRKQPAMDNVRVLERMWSSGLCVFLLGPRSSQAHLALAMAHAHCIPSLRMHFDPHATACEPTLHGAMAWKSEADLLVAVQQQIDSFKGGMVQPVDIARDKGSAAVAARQLGTTQWTADDKQLWQVADGCGLVRHVLTADGLVQDEVNRARKVDRDAFVRASGRDRDFRVCRALYDQFKRHRFVYEIEAQDGTPSGMQKIRTPALIYQSSAATCLDMACMFAAMLEAAGMSPLIVVVTVGTASHALVGYRASHEPPWPDRNLGVLRQAIAAGDAEIFEATGVVEADSAVTIEERDERQDKLLDFTAARSISAKLLTRPDVRLVHLLDVRAQRG
ncbi:MAG: hypothetical protein J0M20_05485 [Burkholderiales bacterium]|nr:hypothetical protein [Burkholderiales bacterium]